MVGHGSLRADSTSDAAEISRESSSGTRAFISKIHTEPELAVELFLFEPKEPEPGD